jgi:hypothetical protein
MHTGLCCLRYCVEPPKEPVVSKLRLCDVESSFFVSEINLTVDVLPHLGVLARIQTKVKHLNPILVTDRVGLVETQQLR